MLGKIRKNILYQSVWPKMFVFRKNPKIFYNLFIF